MFKSLKIIIPIVSLMLLGFFFWPPSQTHASTIGGQLIGAQYCGQDNSQLAPCSIRFFGWNPGDAAYNYQMYSYSFAPPEFAYKRYPFNNASVTIVVCLMENNDVGLFLQGNSICQSYQFNNLTQDYNNVILEPHIFNVDNTNNKYIAYKYVGYEILTQGVQVWFPASISDDGNNVSTDQSVFHYQARNVSIDSFSGPASANPNQQFTVNWSTSENSGSPVELIYSVPPGTTIDGVAVGTSGTIDNKNPTDSINVVATQGGTAHFTLAATGYGSQGYDGYHEVGPITIRSDTANPANPNQPGDVFVNISSPNTPPVCNPISQNVFRRYWVTFTASGGGGDGTYTWSAPGSDPAVQQFTSNSFSTQYANVGDYIMTVTSNGLTSTQCTIHVSNPPGNPPPPTCSPTSPTAAIGETVNFTLNNGQSPYSWSAPGGNPSSGGDSPTFSTQYDSAGTKTVTVSGGGTGSCTVTIGNAPPPGNCVDGASITPTPASLGTLAPGATATVSFHVVNTGNDIWWHGSAYYLTQASALNISPVNGHLPGAMSPNNSTDWSFTLTAPQTPGSYNLQMQMTHNGAWGYLLADNKTTCPPPGQDVNFGLGSISFTVASSYPPTMNMDLPGDGTSVYGSVPVAGWAIDNATQAEGPITNMKMSIDGGAQVVIPFNNVGRPDVCGIWPGRDNCPNVGWQTAWDSTSVTPNQNHTITVTAYDSSGQTASATHTVFVQGPPANTLTFNIVYIPKVLSAPTITMDNSVCGQLTVNWNYTSTGAEDGFKVYRSDDNGATYPNVSSLIPIVSGSHAYSYTDTTPPLVSNNTYYYKVRTHRANGILPAESGDSNIEFRVDQPCLGNLSPSTMSLYQVNGVAYNSSTKIKAGDKLTYKIVIINAGPSSVVISHKSSTPAICENSTSNLLGLTNLVLVSGTASNGGISGNSANCLAKGNIGPELLITGTKDIANNWIMTFDTTFQPSDPNDPQEIVTNSAIIYYTDGNGLHQQTVGPVSVFATTNKARVPTFREVAP